MDISRLTRQTEYRWCIEPAGAMRVPVIIYGSKSLVSGMDDKVCQQAVNVAALTGIRKASFALPDAHWGYGLPEDLTRIEERGCMPGADPACVSERAKTRQQDEMGTLGSGNHYLEVQEISQIHDERIAPAPTSSLALRKARVRPSVPPSTARAGR